MNKNYLRIGIGTLLGIILLSVFIGLLKERTPLVWAAYGWSVGALVMFALSLGFWAAGTKTRFILHAAYPLLVKSYLATTLAVAAFFAIFEIFGIFSIKIGWFCLIELAVFSFFAWRILALDAGREAIMATEEEIKVKTVGWKMLVLDIAAVAERSAGNKAVLRTAETMRFADPMEHPAVAPVAEAIGGKIAELGQAVDAGDAARIDSLCVEIERLVKERAAKLMVLK